MDRADRPHRAYMSFVLHVWPASGHGSQRATLHATVTGHRYNFASLEALFAFLDAQFGSTTEQCNDWDDAVPPDAPAE